MIASNPRFPVLLSDKPFIYRQINTLTKEVLDMLEINAKAPDFELMDQSGNMVRLSDFAGKKVVLYFYPRDNTPGCTRQACAFAGAYALFR